MKNLNEILHSFDDEELCPLFNELHDEVLDDKQLSDIKNNVFSKVEIKAPAKRRPAINKRILTIAACIAICLSLGVGTIIYANDVKEYNDAIDFFKDNKLSTEGLSRTDIKKVYRDVVTERFEFDKTEYVIRTKINSDEIEGYEIDINDFSVDELWNYLKNIESNQQDKVDYNFENVYEDEVIIRSVFRKYHGDDLKWTTELSDFNINYFKIINDSILVYGNSSKSNNVVRITRLNFDGEILWDCSFSNMNEYEYITSGGLLKENSGGYAVISYGDNNYLSLTKISDKGKITFVNKQEVNDNFRIEKTAKLGDGYAVQVYYYLNHDKNANVILLDSDGNIQAEQIYTDEERDYYIEDMIEYNGKLYLSTYAVPKLDEDESDAGGRREIAKILNYIHNKSLFKIDSKELTPIVRKNYEAVLLVCDKVSFHPEKFYSVDGALISWDDSLTISDNGELKWCINSIIGAEYSPYTSSFSLSYYTGKIEYTFDDDGSLSNVATVKEGERILR